MSRQSETDRRRTARVMRRLSGANPSKQARSEETLARLIAAARHLLRTKSLNDISVADLCAESGTSVGSFYARFQGKEAFFRAIVRLAHEERADAFATFLADNDLRSLPLEEVCRRMVAFMVDGMRLNEGITRYSLSRSRHDNREFAAFHDLGRRHREALVECLAPRLAGLSTDARAIRVLYGYDLVAGVLIHAMTNAASTLKLGSPTLVPEVADMFYRYLVAPDR